MCSTGTEIRCTVNINLAVLEHFPEIRDAMLARDWDFCFHGFYNDLPEPRGLSEAEERAWYERAIRMFHDLTGRRMSGANVLSRGSHHMPDLLAELGFLYHADWMHDDQPTPIKVRRGRLVSVPYSMELNDALFVMFQRPWEGEEFFQVAKDQFDRLYAEGADQGMVMCLVLHPWVIGYPQRIGALDRILELRPRSRGGLVRNGGGDCAVLSRQLLRGDDEAPRGRRGENA